MTRSSHQLSLLLLLVLLMLSTATITACKSEHAVEPEEAHRLVKEEGAVLLDVRTHREFGNGHIDGAINIPIQELGGRLDELRQNTPIVVYCQGGGRSAKASELLSERGFSKVHDLGGMSNW